MTLSCKWSLTEKRFLISSCKKFSSDINITWLSFLSFFSEKNPMTDVIELTLTSNSEDEVNLDFNLQGGVEALLTAPKGFISYFTFSCIYI